MTKKTPRSRRRGFADPAVAQTFKSYAPQQRAALAHLRDLILETAAKTDGVGTLTETLKWRQPSYLTAESKSGTTIRIDALKGSDTGYAMYVHCRTGLVSEFRELYGDRLSFRGSRAILFDAAKPLPDAIVRHCISLALTYHRKSRKNS